MSAQTRRGRGHHEPHWPCELLIACRLLCTGPMQPAEGRSRRCTRGGEACLVASSPQPSPNSAVKAFVTYVPSSDLTSARSTTNSVPNSWIQPAGHLGHRCRAPRNGAPLRLTWARPHGCCCDAAGPSSTARSAAVLPPTSAIFRIELVTSRAGPLCWCALRFSRKARTIDDGRRRDPPTHRANQASDR